VKNSVVTKYYFAGSTRLAVRTGGTLSYLLGDHLGSSSVTTDASGVKTASALYKAFGETRYTLGNLGTDYKFTGQREEAALGIYFFNARWMDPSLGRFTSPDTIVPTGTQGTQAWDRYAFVNNNPVRYNDPTGHMICQEGQMASGGKCVNEGDRPIAPPPSGGGGGGKENPPLPPTCDIIDLQCMFPLTPSSVPSYEGFSEPDFILFWNLIASNVNVGLGMQGAYNLYSKGGWRAMTDALPTGWIEAGVAALAQGYKDSWYQNLSPLQRIGRMFLVGAEAYATDGASTLGGAAGGAGGAIGGPVGAFVGYGVGAVTVSVAGNKFWSNTVNPWLVPSLGLGIWP
jgi:RHS repeat-associated protein